MLLHSSEDGPPRKLRIGDDNQVRPDVFPCHVTN